MKILLSGDLHFNMAQYQWLADQKQNYDCLCLAGDFLNGNSDEFTQQTEWVYNWLKKLDTHVFICSGNHDLDDKMECNWLTNIRSSMICRDNQTKLFKGVKFGCIPYLGADLSTFHDCDVLLTHVPPYKTATSLTSGEGSQKDWGDMELYRALKERVVTPQYVLCGHVENPPSNRDCIFGVEIINPGGNHDFPVPGHAKIIISRLPASNSDTLS